MEELKYPNSKISDFYLEKEEGTISDSPLFLLINRIYGDQRPSV
jgi:hypothetical protein